MAVFKLNRMAFKAHTAAEAGNTAAYYNGVSWQERLEIALYLNSIAYNYPLTAPPRLNKTRFSAKSRT